MKKLILFFTTLFLTTALGANIVSMSDFRKAQRQLVLADSKTLYKQRHLSSHKAQLRHKYSRVKKVSHSGVLDHYRPNMIKEQKEEISELVMSSHTENASMQTEANYDLHIIQQHNKDLSYKPDIHTENNNQNDGHTEIPATGINDNIPSNTTDNNQNNAIQENGHSGISNTVENDGTHNSLSDSQLDNIINSNNEENQNTQNHSTSTVPNIRSLYANPWKRR